MHHHFPISLHSFFHPISNSQVFISLFLVFLFCFVGLFVHLLKCSGETITKLSKFCRDHGLAEKGSGTSQGAGRQEAAGSGLPRAPERGRERRAGRGDPGPHLHRASWRVLPADLSCCLMRLRVAGQRGALCPGLALRRGPTGSGPSPLAHPVALGASAYACGEQSGHLPERCSGNAGPTVPAHTAHLPS